MQRIQRDEGRARGSQRIDHGAQIREIAATPVARRPHAVQAEGDSGRTPFDLARPPRAHDEPGVFKRLLLRLFHPVGAQIVIAQPQGRQRRALGNELAAGDRDPLQLRQLRQPEPVVLDLAVLPAELELHRTTRALGGNAQRKRVGVFEYNHRGIERARPSGQIALRGGAFQLLLVRGGNAQRRQGPAQGFVRGRRGSAPRCRCIRARRPSLRRRAPELRGRRPNSSVISVR